MMRFFFEDAWLCEGSKMLCVLHDGLGHDQSWPSEGRGSRRDEEEDEDKDEEEAGPSRTGSVV